MATPVLPVHIVSIDMEDILPKIVILVLLCGCCYTGSIKLEICGGADRTAGKIVTVI